MARRFRFRLQTLLRVRQIREREAERKVGAKNAEIAQLARLSAQTAAEIEHQQHALLAGQQEQRLDPAALQRGRAWVAHLRRLLAQQQARRTTLLTELAELQAAFREARTQTRILERLRERRAAEHAQHVRRAEQAAADELARQLQQFDRTP